MINFQQATVLDVAVLNVAATIQQENSVEFKVLKNTENVGETSSQNRIQRTRFAAILNRLFGRCTAKLFHKIIA